MNNKEISNILQGVGDMLEILGENSFKVTAYQRAARLIDMQSTELEAIYAQFGIDGLKKINGIGQSIAEKIEIIIKTGKLPYYNKLMSRVPPSILKFTKIPGVGPKTAKKLYDVFKAGSLPQLKKLLKSKKHLNEFHKKTRDNIVEGIEILEGQTGRMLLSFGLPIAKKIINRLKSYSEIDKADYVGSLRRMKETIGDIDVVASLKQTTNNKQQVTSKNTIDNFTQESFVKKVINKGDTKVTIISENDVHIDLEILPNNEYGSLLQHFTGSKDHNIALRTYAEKQGLSISEHGIKIMKSEKRKAENKLIKCSTEEKVYSTLKMQTPPPELRENRGEIKVALEHKLPKLITLKDIKGDLQMHSNNSDGQNTILQMAQACKQLGYEYLAITDHPSTLGITQGLKDSDIPNYIKQIKQAEQKAKIRIFSGIEANIKPNGEIDLSDKILKKFDIVLGAVHSSFRQDIDTSTKRIIKAVQNPYVKILAHPTGRIIDSRPSIKAYWKEIYKVSKKTNTILEINSYPDRLDLNDIMIKNAVEMDLKMIINTDSHSVKHLENIKYGVAQARRGWATRNDIINTYSLKKFTQVLNISK